jgi:hypothetical protein
VSPPWSCYRGLSSHRDHIVDDHGGGGSGRTGGGSDDGASHN